MKTATIPSLRVTPELRAAAESVLRDGESLSSLVEDALLQQVERRRTQQAFIARGLTARDEARSTGDYASKDDVLASLDAILEQSRRKR
ncbi:YlcI/YnfO family protein [uncultured Nevskia sp.]|uniref:YlcI/YnfO family protein n=1 Tax=uncultured Nevskia sp. TaxID=228950 RepID=UPI0025FC65DA|nr:YlcI/YnfO family protein [uncultured Nevskia sp.]